MKEVNRMTLAEKITLLRYIKANYSLFEKKWTREKVNWLETIIEQEIINLAKL